MIWYWRLPELLSNDLQADTARRFFDIFKGVRDPDEDNDAAEDSDASDKQSAAEPHTEAKTATSASDESESSSSSSSDSDEAPTDSDSDADEKQHVMSADDQKLVETRLQSLILPPGAGSSSLRRPFMHTGEFLAI